MLRINRVRVEINTFNGLYGIDREFSNGLNLVTSDDNTRGKSSILAAVYYCLGLEQILGGSGGIGSKVLTSAFKSEIADGNATYPVLESGAYLEISNGLEIITVYRNIKSENKDNRLITVYYGAYDEIKDSDTQARDYYVNIQNSATSEQGFHTFLESFMHLNLPLVRSSDGTDRKLYLQVIFSAMFIEQKHGWSDLLSGMPFLGVREPKKRVVEFLLNLDTIKNEKEKERLSTLKARIEENWHKLIIDIQEKADEAECLVENLPPNPNLLTNPEFSRIQLLTIDGLKLDEKIKQQNMEYDSLKQLKPRVSENFEALSDELVSTEADISAYETVLQTTQNELRNTTNTIARLSSSISIINADLRNNEDAARLQKFGSDIIDNSDFARVCPTCKQRIQDTLLTTEDHMPFMNIEENIRHLKEQKKTLEFSLHSRQNSQAALQQQKQQLESQLSTLRRLARTLRSDLNTTIDTEASEAILLKKIGISQQIERLSLLSEDFDCFLEKLSTLVQEWDEYLQQKTLLPKNYLSESDKEKIKQLKEHFIENLKKYHYTSLSSLDDVDIPIESLQPTMDGFDMKFDSSASDNIRVIWAFTMALLQTSLGESGNHPGVLIFDEPGQQSIVTKDMQSFINSVIELGSNCQIITALTLNSKDLTETVTNLESDSFHRIAITEKAFTKLE